MSMIRIPPTQLGVFESEPDVVDGLRTTTGGGGVIIGLDASGAPVLAPMFTRHPREILAIGTLGLIKVLAFRALAVGARVWVETNRPQLWQSFVRTAAGSTGSINLVAHADGIEPPTVDNPALILIDHDAAVSDDSLIGAPWVSVLTAYDRLEEWSSEDLVQADLVVMQPLTIAEAQVLGRALNLEKPADVLTQLPPDVVTLANRRGMQAARLGVTSVEQWLIGEIAR